MLRTKLEGGFKTSYVNYYYDHLKIIHRYLIFILSYNPNIIQTLVKLQMEVVKNSHLCSPLTIK